jgi:hypothetical protein
MGFCELTYVDFEIYEKGLQVECSQPFSNLFL